MPDSSLSLLMMNRGEEIMTELHSIAEWVRQRDEPIKTFFSALLGVAVASSFAIAADGVTLRLAGNGFLRDQTTNSVVVVLITFLWTAASVVLGGYVVARLHDTRAALFTYIVLELLLGAGLVALIWSPGSPWYDISVLVLIIPCAILGSAMAPPRGLKWMVRPIR